MNVVLLMMAGSLGLVLVSLFAKRFSSNTMLAKYVEQARELSSTPHVYRVASDAERKDVPVVNVEGMRELGVLAVPYRGTVGVGRYVVDETGTIFATRHDDRLFIGSTAGSVQYVTFCMRVGLPAAAPHVDREWFPVEATDRKMLIAHRARIAKATEPLVRISTIEQLAEQHTEHARRTAEWRAAQDPDALFDADLRSILRDTYPARVEKIKAKLGSRMPKARVVS